MGDVAKIHAVYSTPRSGATEGLSGQATVYGDHAVGVVFDNSPEDADTAYSCRFVYADRQRSMVGAVARTTAGPACSSTRSRTVRRPPRPHRRYTEKIWPQDAWARGGYAANPAPGVWFEHGADGLAYSLRAASTGPARRPRASGTATSTEPSRRAARAAEEIRKRLSR